MPEGIIVKALSGYYYVLPDSGEDSLAGYEARLVQCRGRGILKKNNISPLVGDRVSFGHSENGEGTVDRVLPRESELIRPPVANISQAVLVFSLDEPALNLQLLDKFLVHIEHSGLDSVICFSKQDLVQQDGQPAVEEEGGTDGPSATEGQSPAESPAYSQQPADRRSLPASAAGRDELDADAVYRLYESIGYRVLVTSAKQREGLEQVRETLKGKISVFSGQSGVGKSTLLNALLPHLDLDTAEISMKLGRGRHTTRHVELLPLPEGGWVADTPGFSQLDFMEMEPEELGATFREFVPLSEGCRFRGCLHHKEPGCRVRQAVDEGTVAQSRYDHYLQFLQEMKDRKRRY
ncbi:MAG: rsgA [Paenibacillaceae bacterium]|jgi:ribosome biogenesis GTPase|nr:rsgA [Paenibacillaceae bacterium]